VARASGRKEPWTELGWVPPKKCGMRNAMRMRAACQGGTHSTLRWLKGGIFAIFPRYHGRQDSGSRPMAKLSIILPSVFHGDVAATIKSFEENTKSLDYEIVVVSPFEVARPRVVWVPERNPRGNVAANVEAF